jgi:hypothetical protein
LADEVEVVVCEDRLEDAALGELEPDVEETPALALAGASGDVGEGTGDGYAR